MGKVRWGVLWKRYKFVLIVVLVGIVLMLLPTSGREKTEEITSTQGEDFNLEETEHRMEEMLEKINGVGKVRLMLTLQSGSRLTLAERIQTEQMKEQSRIEREPLTLNRGSGTQEAVITNRFYPIYQGAVVVCQGADSSTVQLAVTESIQALTGLGADRIRVVKWTQ